jgi:hypothetical protein
MLTEAESVIRMHRKLVAAYKRQLERQSEPGYVAAQVADSQQRETSSNNAEDGSTETEPPSAAGDAKTYISSTIASDDSRAVGCVPVMPTAQPSISEPPAVPQPATDGTPVEKELGDDAPTQQVSAKLIE